MPSLNQNSTLVTATSNSITSSPNSSVNTCKVYFNSSLGNTATTVVSSQCRLHGFHIENPGTSKCYIQFFDATAQNVNLGTTTPKMSFLLVPSGGLDNFYPMALAGFDTALTIAVTSSSNGSSAPSANCLINLFYI